MSDFVENRIFNFLFTETEYVFRDLDRALAISADTESALVAVDAEPPVLLAEPMFLELAIGELGGHKASVGLHGLHEI